ncbi:MAG: peptidoglycan DD-metalloendopeptidase family protein [Acidobacteriota bacterium]
MMTGLVASLPSAELTTALLGSLLASLWQGAVLALGFLVLRPFARRPSERHALGVVALFGLVVTWLTTLVMGWRAPAPESLPLLLVAPAPEAGLLSRVLLGAWALGVAWSGLRLLGGWWRLRSLVVSAEPSRWQPLLDELRGRLAVSRAVRLLESVRVSVPMVVGWLRPVVLLPPALVVGLDPRQLEAILLHELAHVRRRDDLVNALQCVAETLLFFNPAARWLSSCIREDRELCCDDLAAEALGSRREQAAALAAVAHWRSSIPVLALPAHGGSLVKRVTHLLQPAPVDSSELGRSRRVVLPGLLVLLSLTVLGAQAVSEPSSSSWLPPDVTRFMDEFRRAGDEHGVDPGLLAVMTLVESGGNPEAISSRGARGLMQVMPETAEVIADARGLPRPSDDELLDPAVSTDLGAWYLARQLETFGDEDTAIAAYNAGPNRARQWVEDGKPLPLETSGYLSLIRSLLDERAQRKNEAYEEWRETKRSRLAERARPMLPSGRVTSTFGTKRDPFSGDHRFHQGVDLAAPRGTPVVAPLPGRVVVAGDAGAWGNTVVLSHGAGIATHYAHLDRVDVRVGERLEAGEVLGAVGSTGRSTGPHLHFEVREMGAAIDPERFVKIER